MSDIAVSRTINAPTARLFAMVSELSRMGEWSPENTGGQWKKPATGPAVGARFVGKNRKGFARWSTTCTVVECTAPTAFSFDVTSGPMKVARWGYRFQDKGDGSTIVTETFDDHRKPWAAKLTGIILRTPDRHAHNKAGMEATLNKLAAAAEAGQS